MIEQAGANNARTRGAKKAVEAAVADTIESMFGVIDEMASKKSQDAVCSILVGGEERVIGRLMTIEGASSAVLLRSAETDGRYKLYWYLPLAGVVTQKTFVLNRCYIKGSNNLILGVWHTRCTKPVRHLVLYDELAKATYIYKDVLTKLKMDVERKVDQPLANSEYEEFIKLNRWKYELVRGLCEFCKTPQQSDEVLKFRYKYFGKMTSNETPAIDVRKGVHAIAFEFCHASHLHMQIPLLLPSALGQRRTQRPNGRKLSNCRKLSYCPTATMTLRLHRRSLR